MELEDFQITCESLENKFVFKKPIIVLNECSRSQTESRNKLVSTNIKKDEPMEIIQWNPVVSSCSNSDSIITEVPLFISRNKNSADDQNHKSVVSSGVVSESSTDECKNVESKNKSQSSATSCAVHLVPLSQELVKSEVLIVGDHISSDHDENHISNTSTGSVVETNSSTLEIVDTKDELKWSRNFCEVRLVPLSPEIVNRKRVVCRQLTNKNDLSCAETLLGFYAVDIDERTFQLYCPRISLIDAQLKKKKYFKKFGMNLIKNSSILSERDEFNNDLGLF